jgi:ketosteroid isomerase-like protein
MPQPSNLEIIRRLYAEYLSVPERLTSTELLDFFDPEVEINQSASVIGTDGTFRGYAGLARVAQEVFGAFRDVHWVPRRLETTGDDVVAFVESRAHGRESGVAVSAPVIHTWTLRDGLIVRWRVSFDRADDQ